MAVIHVVGAHGDLVSFAFSVPRYHKEALLRELFLRSAGVLLGEGALLAAFRGAIESIGRVFELIYSDVRAATSGMLDNTEIASREETISTESAKGSKK